MKKLLREGPSNWVPTLIALAALMVAMSGTAYAVKSINGKTIKNRSIPAKKIKKNALGPNEINEKRLAAKLPAVKQALAADTAKVAEQSNSTKGYYNSGLIRLNNGQSQVVTKVGSLEFHAACTDEGGGNSRVRVFAKNAGTANAIGNGNYNSSYDPPLSIAPGDEFDVLYPTTDNSPYWFADYYTLFALASEDGTAISGYGSNGVKVLGADCAFQLVLFG